MIFSKEEVLRRLYVYDGVFFYFRGVLYSTAVYYHICEPEKKKGSVYKKNF